jgi:hypothetical protein
MCTNSSDIIFEYDLKDESVISKLRDEGNFVEIYSKLPNSEYYTKECYLRTQLLDSIIKEKINTTTLWGDCSIDQRIKMVGKLIWSNEYILERSIRFLYNKKFISFLKHNCHDERIGSYFGRSTVHGEKNTVCRLSPLIEDNGDDSMIIRVQGEPAKYFSHAMNIRYDVPDTFNSSNKSPGLFIGEMFYTKSELIELLDELVDKFNKISEKISSLENKSVDHRNILSSFSNILHRIKKIKEGKKHFNLLKLDLDLLSISLSEYPNTYTLVNKIINVLDTRKTTTYLNGYGEWIYFNNIISSCGYVSKPVDTEPVRKEIVGYWKDSVPNGPFYIINSTSLEEFNINLVYINNKQTLYNKTYKGIKQGDRFIIKDSQNNELFNIKDDAVGYDTPINRFGKEMFVKENILFDLFSLYGETNQSYIKELIRHILLLGVNPLEFIELVEPINENIVGWYRMLMKDVWLVNTFTSIKSYDQYFYKLINKCSDILVPENNDEINKKLITKVIDFIPSDIKTSYRNNGFYLTHLLVRLYPENNTFILNTIQKMVEDENIKLAVVNSNNKNIFHYVFYIFQDYLHKLKYNIKLIETFMETLLPLSTKQDDDVQQEYKDVKIVRTIDAQDVNGLTILHLALMIKNYNPKKLVEIILSYKPDLSLISTFPLKATPLETAILFDQPQDIINLLLANSPAQRIEKDIETNKNMFKIKFDDEFYILPLAEQEENEETQDNLQEEENNEEEEEEDININEEEEEEDININEEEETKIETIDISNNSQEELFENEEAYFRHKEEEENNEEDSEEKYNISNIKNEEDIDIIEEQISNLTEQEVNTTYENANTVGHLLMMNEVLNDNLNDLIELFYILSNRNYDINKINSENKTPLGIFIDKLPYLEYTVTRSGKLRHENTDIYSEFVSTLITYGATVNEDMLVSVVKRGDGYVGLVNVLLTQFNQVPKLAYDELNKLEDVISQKIRIEFEEIEL